jgi:hypothetical protein
LGVTSRISRAASSISVDGQALRWRLRARETMKHVHPAYDRATVDFDRIAIGTGPDPDEMGTQG